MPNVHQCVHQCGLHVINMLLGSQVYTSASLASLVVSMDRSSKDHDMEFIGLPDLMTQSGDYSQDVLMFAITEALDDCSSFPGSYPLVPADGAVVLERIKDANVSMNAIVIQYGDSHGHWLCFRKDGDGTWWNLDSLLPRAVPMGVAEAVKSGTLPHVLQRTSYGSPLPE